jgi:Nuclear pore protein 84 / 107
MVALDAMETFASVAARQSELGADARHAKTWKQEMQHASDSVAAAMEPLLEPGWLAHPATPREGAEIAAIRAAYLPELILAYVFVISTCGQVLSRDILLRGMDLATIVAGAGDSSVPATMDGAPSPSHRRKSSASVPPGDAVDREELARCFRRAGRMAELVNALAALGRLIVQADEKGRKGGRRSGRRSGSEGLGIWTVGGAKGRVLAVEEETQRYLA